MATPEDIVTPGQSRWEGTLVHGSGCGHRNVWPQLLQSLTHFAISIEKCVLLITSKGLRKSQKEEIVLCFHSVLSAHRDRAPTARIHFPPPYQKVTPHCLLQINHRHFLEFVFI